MQYESEVEVESRVAAGVRYRVARVSFGRRMDLMRQIRELSRRLEFLEAGETTGEKMEATLVRAGVNRALLNWGLKAVSGLELDGLPATPQALIELGPEELAREALDAVRSQLGLSEDERKN